MKSMLFFIFFALIFIIPEVWAIPLDLESIQLGTADSNGELLLQRRASLLRMGDPKYFGLRNPHVRSHDILAATALLGCGPVEWASFMIALPGKPSVEEPVELFSLPPLVRYLYQYGYCLSGAEKNQLLGNFSKHQNILGHGTLNQAIVRASSWYLLAQYFPKAIWNDVNTQKNYTSSQLMKILKPLMLERTVQIFKSGHYEWLSPNYAAANQYALLNLIDFSSDQVVKKIATDEAILEIAVLRAHSFHGVIVPPLTRKNFDQHNAEDQSRGYAPSISQELIWYYFGEPAGFGIYDFRSGLGSYFISMLAISPWLPPRPVLDMDATSDTESLVDQVIKVVTPQFTVWGESSEPEIFGDSLITDSFSIGTGNVNFDPYGYSGHIQTFSILLKSTKPYNEIECYQPFWHSSAGEDAWLSDRSSPFQQMLRYDDSSVVMVFDTPRTDPWKSDANNRFWADRSSNQNNLLQLVICRFARDFDEIIEEKNWIFAREGNVFVAMATLKGHNQYDEASSALLKNFKVIKIHEAKTALFFRVEKQTEILDFKKFRDLVRDKLPIYDDSTSTVRIVEKSGVTTQFKFSIQPPKNGKFWSALPEIISDGKIVRYSNDYAVRSREMNLRGGILHIVSNGKKFDISH